MLGRERDLGTVEANKLADLVILEGDPLEDIRNITRIHRVVKGGEVHDPVLFLPPRRQ
jgi:imidazolonepropionase-like amidohydrolase